MPDTDVDPNVKLINALIARCPFRAGPVGHPAVEMVLGLIRTLHPKCRPVHRVGHGLFLYVDHGSYRGITRVLKFYAIYVEEVFPDGSGWVIKNGLEPKQDYKLTRTTDPSFPWNYPTCWDRLLRDMGD